MAKENISATVDPEVAAYLGQDRINTSGLINKLVKEHMNGGEQVNNAIREFRIQQLQTQIENNQNENEQLRGELERLQEEATRAEQGKRNDLDDVLDDMARLESTMHAAHPTIDKLASDWFNGDNQEAFEALQERNEQREDPIPEDRFTEAQ